MFPALPFELVRGMSDMTEPPVFHIFSKPINASMGWSKSQSQTNKMDRLCPVYSVPLFIPIMIGIPNFS